MGSSLGEAARSRTTVVSSWIAAVCAVYATAGGAVSLLGWLLKMPRLSDWIGSGINIKANPSLCILLSGLAAIVLVWRPQRVNLVRGLAGTVLTIVTLTLIEHVTGADLGIDNLIVREPPGALATSAPGRMGIPATSSLILLSASLLLATFGTRARRWASGLALAALTISLNSIIGWVYGASSLYTLPRLTGIALQTATMLACLGVGIVVAIYDVGVGAALRREDAGGVVMRRLTLPVLVIPLLFGLVRVQGQSAGLYDSNFGTSVYTLTTVLCTFFLVLWCAKGIGDLAEAERASRDALVEANRELERRVEARTADLVSKIGELEGFCYSVSHDMRAPLRAIVGNARIVLEEQGDRLDADGKAGLESLAAAAKKMALLVDDLLAYARLGQAKPSLQECDLSAMAQNVADEVLHDHGDVDAEIEVVPRIVQKCDPRLIGLVLHNLIDNALKYRVEGRPVHIQIGQTAEGAVYVRDNGIGFEMQYAERIFKAFERLHRDSDFAGTGIGLANVQRIVERHGGRVWAEGEPGIGATFYFTLG